MTIEQLKTPVFGKSLLIEGIEFTGIESGQFKMGKLPADTFCSFDIDLPVHDVKIQNGFWIGKYPIKQVQWKNIMGNYPSHFRGDDLPVDRVGWFNCIKFCEILSKKIGFNIRLPSESEWEYVCRAGTTTTYYTGNEESDLKKACWYRNNSDGQTHPVGLKEPNDFGVYDMHGNVSEWCMDWLNYNYDGAPDDGSPWQTGDKSRRITRGGNWYTNAEFCRSAFRTAPADLEFSPISVGQIGFRIVLVAP